jgi:hypothetical protein
MLPFEAQEFMVTEQKETKPVIMNAFELISLSHGLNLSGLFETPQVWQIPSSGLGGWNYILLSILILKYKPLKLLI